MPSRYVEDDGRIVAPQGSLSTLYEDDLSGVATLARFHPLFVLSSLSNHDR